jgi:hypothetical protein
METFLLIVGCIALTCLFEFMWDLIFDDSLNGLRDLLIYGALLCYCLSDCKPRTKPAPTQVVITTDTSRLQLKRQVDASGKVLITITRKADSTLTENQKTLQRYDAIRISLP